MHEMKDMVDVVRCHRCEKWRNFAVRKDAKPEDLGLCTQYSIVKEASGYCDKYRNVLEDREISEFVWDVLTLLHDYDWYRSGDTSRKKYEEAVRKFKRKWLGVSRCDQIKRVIDDAIADTRSELYQTFNIKEDSAGD